MEESEDEVKKPGEPRPRKSLPRMSDPRTRKITRQSPIQDAYSSLVSSESPSSSEFDYSPEERHLRGHSIPHSKSPKTKSSTATEGADQDSEDSCDEGKHKTPPTSSRSSRSSKSPSQKRQSESGAERYQQFRAVRYHKESLRPNPKKKDNSTFFYFAIMLVVVLSLGYFLLGNGEKHSGESLESLIKSVQDLKKTFTHQKSSIWPEIVSGINSVAVDSHKIGIFMLISNQQHPMNCLAKNLGNISSSILGGRGSLVLTPRDFPSSTGAVIDKLRHKVPSSKSVVIEDILNVNVQALKAFHAACDRVTPLVTPVVYIITMLTDGSNNLQNPFEFAEEKIRTTLSEKIDEDALLALITRLTDGAIFIVEPEPTVKYCLV